MNILNFALLTILLSLLSACNEQKRDAETEQVRQNEAHTPDTIKQESDTGIVAEENIESLPDTAFVVMNKYASSFAYDMKYATEDNFLKQGVYSCDQCLVRKEVADALKKANEAFVSKGYRIKFYDCYRPLDVQKKMWEIYPDSRYVANPNRSGSIHNRGGAVDITLVDLTDQELDMGTGFDHFGKEAHLTYTDLPDTVLSNRRLLKETMEAHGFQSLSSEWWHYTYKSGKKYSLSNFKVECY